MIAAEISAMSADDVARLAREVSRLDPRERTRMFRLVGNLQKRGLPVATYAQDPLLDLARRGWEALTLREEQVMCLVVGGLGNKEVATRLGISQRTVELHRSRVMQKMCAKNAANLCGIVAALGIVENYPAAP